MKKFLILFFFLSLSFFVRAQKIGLVFSGGGAKGLAHVGVLKALEENGIPIDYIVGTSMGGIVGGCYAAGMSPKQIEQLVLSEEFLRLVNGIPEHGFNSFYHRGDDTPQFLKLNLAVDSTLSLQFNTSIAKDFALNFGLAEKMAQASAISNNNFDSLFIPIRVIAADIFTQREIILSKGSLSDALRATQSVPFFYEPIRVDGKYLFDGGVYNNFPVDILQLEFNPDVIIGSNVSSKIYDEYPYGKDEKLISRSLIFMLLDKSDPAQIPSTGVYIQPNLQGYGVYDFTQIKGLVDSGYAQTMRQMDEIKRKVGWRKSVEEVAVERTRFTNKSYPFIFEGLKFKNFNANNRGYLRHVFKDSKRNGGELSFSQIKEGYYKLISEEYFRNTYPNILYDSSKKHFALQLTKRPQQNFKVDFGGVIATRDISNIFLGLNFFRFNRTLTHAFLGFQTGNFYKSATAKVRIDFPYQFYLEPYVQYNGKNYLQTDDVLNQVSSANEPTVLKRINRKYGMHVGFPIDNYFKGVLFFEAFSDVDRYIDGDVFISTDQLDELKINGFKTGIEFTSNSLNRKQYASSGKAFTFSADYFHAKENFTPGSTSVDTLSISTNQWFRLRATAEQYFSTGWFKPGYYLDAVFSNQPVFQNYFGTIINAPAFLPMQDSPTLILENFRSFMYLAVGSRNVFTLSSKFDIRLEAYAFKPIDYITQSSDQQAKVNRDTKTVFLAGTAGLVYHSVIGPVSLSANYYDDDQNQFGVLLHIGFLLFNNHSLE